MDFNLSEEHLMIRDAARDFAKPNYFQALLNEILTSVSRLSRLRKWQNWDS